MVAYASSLEGQFILDDEPEITKEAAIQPPLSVGKILATPRPVVTFSLAVNYAAGGADVFGYHVLNTLAHILCGLVLFGFARYTLLLPVHGGRYDRAADQLAFLASALFLVHPIQTESVTYVIQRAEIFVSIALLAALWIAAVTAQRRRDRLLPLASLAFVGVLGLASKPSFVVVPLLFALYDWCFLAAGRLRAMREKLDVYQVTTVLAIATYLLASAWMSESHSAGFGFRDITPWQYLKWQFGVLVYYLRLIVLPNRLCFDCGYFGPWPVKTSLLGDHVLLPALILVAVFVVAWGIRARYPLATFSLLGSAIVLAPTSSIMPLADVYVEHRLYLPIAFLAMLAVAGVHDAAVRAMAGSQVDARAVGIAGWLLATTVLGVLTIATIDRNNLYHSAEQVWLDAVAKAPRSRRAPYNLANIYLREQRWAEAEKYYKETIALNPSASRAYINLGNVYLSMGRLEDAAMAYEAGRQREPELGLVHRNLAATYNRLGRWDDAIAVARKAVQLAPTSVRGRKVLAAAYAGAGEKEKALRQWQVVLRANPNDAEARRKIEALKGD